MKCEEARRAAHDREWQDAPTPACSDEPAARAQLEEHLSSCPDCRAWLQEVRALRSGLRVLGDQHPPHDLVSRTMSALRLERVRSSRRRRQGLRLRRALAAAAAAIAIAVAGAYLARERSQNAAISTSSGANVAPLVAEYADFRAAHPFGNYGAVPLIRARVEQERQERE